MLPSPRVIAIDDEKTHLDGLTGSLFSHGVPCVPVHYPAPEREIPHCPHARVIFVDLHLGTGAPSDHQQDFSTIAGLIEDYFKPRGPYTILLWTKYPKQARNLHSYLLERLEGAPRPFGVYPLDKGNHLDDNGNVKDVPSLMKEIESALACYPQMGALVDWEERAIAAAGETTASIVGVARNESVGSDLATEVGRVLARLAEAAVGNDHVKEDEFRAVNEALIPILADRMSASRSTESAERDLWKEAVGDADQGGKTPIEQAAKLNRLLHLAPLKSAGEEVERGTVVDLPEEFTGEAFAVVFGLCADDAAEKQFRRKRDARDGARWVLVQTQAACDYAQRQPGPVPFHLGLWLPPDAVPRGRKAPDALWESPPLEAPDGVAGYLHVSARFQISLTRERAREATKRFRLREQLLNDLIYRIHGYGARPGIVSLRP